jgi:SAM-dependent methyltransferase
MVNMHETNRQWWDATAERWRELRERDGLWRTCLQEPEVAFEGEAFELIQRCVGALAGKEVCVIGSGDNYAAFALAGCGARVTSVDIAQRQLDIAAERARSLGLQIEFVRSDAVHLNELPNSRFDLVTSTNGFFVWISDPAALFSAVYRLLRPGGFYVFYDIHPFLRPWKDERGQVKMTEPYWFRGPLERSSENEGYEFHWTLADLVNPLLETGFQLRRIAESLPRSARFFRGDSYEDLDDDQLMDWQYNWLAGLPAWLTVAAQKPHVEQPA